MTFTINGEKKDSGAQTVLALLNEMDINPAGVAVEVNLSIIKKKDYESFRLKEGDSIEIVNFVGGG